MRFVSDNAAPAHPKVLEAIVASNRLDAAYDGDQWSKRLDGVFSDLFETEVRALWVSTGTAANCLALSALCPPYRAILCHREAHIETDEAGAPGFFTGGAKLVLLDGDGAKLSPEAVVAGCDRIWKDVHQVQPATISITNATEYGRVYRAHEVAAPPCSAQRRMLSPPGERRRTQASRAPARSVPAAASVISEADSQRGNGPAASHDAFRRRRIP